MCTIPIVVPQFVEKESDWMNVCGAHSKQGMGSEGQSLRAMLLGNECTFD